jgi:hypothetical protein
MIKSRPTYTKTSISINQNITITECLNNTVNKYDDKTVNLTLIPEKIVKENRKLNQIK